jgi:glutamine synthetase
MLLRPDPATYRMLPWLSDGHGQTARLLCDIATPDGEPFPGCPRSALKRVIAEAEALGFVMNAGPEAEFFIFHLDAEGKPTLKTHDQGSYFDLTPLDKGEDARRDIVIGLQGIGFDVEASHHEVAPAQHEIDFRYADALATADNVVTLKSAVRSLARQRGLCATFMPKPITGIAGSGMHVHQSLFLGGSNAFADPEGEYGLSQLCLNYLGGLLAHARGFTAITNPLINSYKRLVPGYEAPVYIAWSERNRSPLVRVPARRGAGTRLELRNPDGACNPYLALAVMLKAGLDGIRNGLVPPPPVNRNIYLMSDDERRRLGIGSLPARLSDAVEELLADQVIQSALGDHIISHFVDAKRLETDVYRAQVSQWELEQYLAVY